MADEMEARREMVAERVMKWKPLERMGCILWVDSSGANTGYCKQRYDSSDPPVFDPFEDIAAAWEVVEKLQDHGMAMSLVFGVYTWECKFGDAGDVFGEAKHPDAPLAICHAALEAMGANG